MKYAIAFLLMNFALLAQAQTSESNPKLRDALNRFPRADANGDGLLTLPEAMAFKRKRQADEPKQRDHRDVAGGHAYTYKQVGEKQLPLYVFTPPGHADGAKVPAIVFFHGGGFRNGSPNQFQRQCEYLAARGMVTITVRYRLTREKGVEVMDCVEDAISAMRWVRVNADKLGVDPNRIAAGGGSAGGFLAVATLMMDDVNAPTDPENVSAKPNALVLFNAAFGPRGEAGNDPRDPEGKGDLKKYVKPNQPPCINFFGTEDPFLAGAQRFQEAYKQAGNQCEILTYEGEGHSFFNKDKYRELTLAETDKFLVGLGYSKEPTAAP